MPFDLTPILQEADEFKRISELFLSTESWQDVTNIVETYQGNLNEVNVSIAWSALGRSVRFSHKDRQELRSSKDYVLRDLKALTEQVEFYCSFLSS